MSTPAERAWAMVDRRGPDECWPFTGSKGRGGYGRISVGGRGGRLVRVHRLLYEDVNGPIPETDEEGNYIVVRHTCDYPPCCNPTHWILGTQADNVQDREDRHRRTAPRGTAHPRALPPETVTAIREAYQPGVTQQQVADQFGVSQAIVSRIIRGEHWIDKAS